MNKVQKQQGDVNIWKTTRLPKGAKEIGTNVVREGEVTGHMHEIVGSDFQLYSHDDQVVAKIRSDDCELVHPEHGPIELEPGIWEFGGTHEYDYDRRSRRSPRYVAD